MILLEFMWTGTGGQGGRGETGHYFHEYHYCCLQRHCLSLRSLVKRLGGGGGGGYLHVLEYEGPTH